MQARSLGVVVCCCDITRLVCFLCDERNSFVNGENITFGGGMSRSMIYHDDYEWKLD